MSESGTVVTKATSGANMTSDDRYTSIHTHIVFSKRTSICAKKTKTNHAHFSRRQHEGQLISDGGCKGS